MKCCQLRISLHMLGIVAFLDITPFRWDLEAYAERGEEFWFANATVGPIRTGLSWFKPVPTAADDEGAER